MTNIISKVEKLLKNNYSASFTNYGPTLLGLDWESEANAVLRYNNMLKLLSQSLHNGAIISILDVGCGYGRFLQHLREHLEENSLQIRINYTGIDLVSEMIDYCSQNYNNATFLKKSLFELEVGKKFDYVFCNGVLTKKCAATQEEMDIFSKAVIYRLWELSLRGVYFNLFSNKVNWFENEPYYCSPIEMLAYSLQLTRYVCIDHTVPIYEYCVYLYQKEHFENV